MTGRSNAQHIGAEDLRSTAARVYRGAAILAGAQVVSRVIGLAYTFLLARVLTIADFGTYNLVLTLIVVAGLLQDFGLSKSVVKEVARAPGSWCNWLEKLLPLKLGLGLVALVSVPVLASLAGYPENTVKVLAFAAFILPGSNIWLLFENVAQGRNAILVLGCAYVVNAALQSSLGLLAAALTGGDLEVVVISMVAGNLASAVFLGLLLRRSIGAFVPRIDVTFWRTSLRDSLPYLGIGVIAASLGRVEALLLGRLVGDVEVALFVVGFKFFETLLFVIHTFQIAINPSLARALAVDRKLLSTLFAWQVSGSLAIAIPVAVCLVLASGLLIATIFPPDFASATTPTAVLFATVPFAAIQIFGSGLLTLTNRQHATMLTLGSIAACEVLLDLALIPFAGAMGAAIAVAVSQVAGAAATVFLIRRWLLPDDQVYKALGRIGLALSAAVPTGIGCLAVAGPPVAAAAAICVYVAGLAVLRIGILPPKAA
jgi:O-antigen/teichoic acid export membrane protein